MILPMPEKTFVDLFREAVAKYPDRPAVRDGMGELTYKELDHMSDYVSSEAYGKWLWQGKGCRHFVRKTKEYAVAYIGVMKAGGAYVPLDPEYPQSRN